MMTKNTKPLYKIDNQKLTRLVEKAQGGSEKAMQDVVNMVSGYIYYYSLTLLGDDDKARDAVQDILLTMLKKLDSLRDPKVFLGWIKIITANYCHSKLTRTKESFSLDETTFELTDADEQFCPEKAAETGEVCRLVREAVKTLPQKLRESVLMFYFHQMSVRQIAETLDVNESTVKSRLFSARQNMKKYLEEYGGAALALCSTPPMSLVSYSLISEAEQKKGLLIPYATPKGAIKIAAPNAAAAVGFPLKLAVAGAACAVVIGGIGGAAAAGVFTQKNSSPFVEANEPAGYVHSSNDAFFAGKHGPNTVNHSGGIADAPTTSPTQVNPAQKKTASAPAAAQQTATAAPGAKTNAAANEPTATKATNPPQTKETQPVDTTAPQDKNAPEWTQRSDSKLYFYADPQYWQQTAAVYAYIYERDGEALIDWGKNSAAMVSEGGNIWSFDLAKNNLSLSPGKQYGVIFSADWKEQTPDMILGASCLGDLAYMGGDVTTGKTDGNSTPNQIRWVNQSRSVYAQPITISSVGEVSGEAYWAGDTAESLLKDYMTRYNMSYVARLKGMTVRESVYATGSQLGLSNAQVDAIAKSAGVSLGT